MNTRLTQLTPLTELMELPALTEHEHAAVDGAAVAVLETLDGQELDAWDGAVALAESLACHLQATVPDAALQREWLRRLVAGIESNLAPSTPPDLMRVLAGMAQAGEGREWN